MNPSKLIEHGAEARQKMFNGIAKLAKAVKATIGPRGRNAILGRIFNYPTITNDGVTIAKEINLEDPFENMGALLIREVADKTNDIAGDGTTTATILAEAMISQGMREVEENKVNPMMLKKGIEDAVEDVTKYLDENKKEVSDKSQTKNVATISAQNEEIGELISEVFDKVGGDGVVQVEEGISNNTEIEMTEGMSFPGGLISPLMVTDPARMEATFEDVPVLVTDKTINLQTDLVPLMNKLAAKGTKRIAIIAGSVEGVALGLLIMNKQQGIFDSIAVQAPGFGANRDEMLQDIAIITGAQFISEKVGLTLENVEPTQLGKAHKIISRKEGTTIVEGKGAKEAITKRVDTIKGQIDNCTSDFDREKMQERLARLTGGIAVIKVGAATEIELKEKKHRIEDALSATRAAMEEGIVTGGGVALLQAVNQPHAIPKGDKGIGYTIVLEALKEPFMQITRNAGLDGEKIADQLKERWKVDKEIGYDADVPIDAPDEDRLVNMFDVGIIDPRKVTQSALVHAASIAAMFLTTESAITDKPKDPKATDDLPPPM